MRISVVGLGFVGLTTAVHLALRGHEVIISSNDRIKVAKLADGVPPFFEPDLSTSLRQVLGNGKLNVFVGRETAVLETDLTFITVGTPSNSDGSPDLGYIGSSSREIGVALGKKQTYHLVVVRSTVPPGTCENFVKPILEEYSGKKVGGDIGLAMNPEFLREGSALHDIANPTRVLIGEYDEHSGEILEDLTQQLYSGKCPILRMNLATAELAKYACNAFLATKISFINQIANICEKIPRIDIIEIAKAMSLDPRIGSGFLGAGAGWGGSCFPKDTNALVHFSRRVGYELKLVEEAIAINSQQARHMIELAEEELGDLEGKRIAVLGLSFKPKTDDIRNATSLKIIKLLLEKGALINVYDPVAMSHVEQSLGSEVSYSSGVEECLKDADCCMVVTEWDEFKELNPDEFLHMMRTPIVIDGRRIYDSALFSRKLRFRAIGLGDIGR